MRHNGFDRRSADIGRNKPQLPFGKKGERAEVFSLVQLYVRKFELYQTCRKHLGFAALRFAKERKLRADRYIQIEPLPIGSEIIAEGQFEYVRQKL